MTLRRRLAAPALLALFVVACAGTPTAPPLEPAPTAIGSADAEPSNAIVLADGDYSLSLDSALRIRVYRSGALAQLGHNHVVVAPLQGSVRIGGGRLASIALASPLADWRIDEPAERAAAGVGFESVPDANATAATRANMLSAALLNASAHPVLRITGSSTADATPLPRMQIDTEVELAGRRTALPVELVVAHEASVWRARGSMRVGHASLGLKPYTALGGALAVAEEMDLLVDVALGERSAASRGGRAPSISPSAAP